MSLNTLLKILTQADENAVNAYFCRYRNDFIDANLFNKSYFLNKKPLNVDSKELIDAIVENQKRGLTPISTHFLNTLPGFVIFYFDSSGDITKAKEFQHINDTYKSKIKKLVDTYKEKLMKFEKIAKFYNGLSFMTDQDFVNHEIFIKNGGPGLELVSSMEEIMKDSGTMIDDEKCLEFLNRKKKAEAEVVRIKNKRVQCEVANFYTSKGITGCTGDTYDVREQLIILEINKAMRGEKSLYDEVKSMGTTISIPINSGYVHINFGHPSINSGNVICNAEEIASFTDFKDELSSVREEAAEKVKSIKSVAENIIESFKDKYGIGLDYNGLYNIILQRLNNGGRSIHDEFQCHKNKRLDEIREKCKNGKMNLLKGVIDDSEFIKNVDLELSKFYEYLLAIHQMATIASQG
jgi:hypothetical protein